MAKKRRHNEGSIHKRSRGTWRAQVTIDGKRLSHNARSLKECQDWIRRIQNQIDSGLTYEGANTTLQEFIEDCMISLEANLKPSTILQYRQLSKDYIFPTLGDIKLIELRPDQIQALYNKLVKSGLSFRTVQLTHAVLRRCLNIAVKLGILGRNPTAATNPPKPKAKEMQFYDQEQVNHLLIAVSVKQPKNLALFQLAITTGLRLGELLGLKWQDLNEMRRSLRIQRQLRQIPYEGLQFEIPKTRTSIRTITIGQNMLNVLLDHRKFQNELMNKSGEKWQDNNLIFSKDDGSPIPPRRAQKYFKRAIGDAGLPVIRFHDLRHTAASLMLNQGIPVLVVSKRLGHAKPSITLDIYGHLISVYQEEAASLMDEIVTPIKVENTIFSKDCT